MSGPAAEGGTGPGVDGVDAQGLPLPPEVADASAEEGTVVERTPVEGPPRLRPVAGGRHEARERAVHLLYEAEIKGLGVDELLAAQVLAPDDYSIDLVTGVERHRAELDRTISSMARGWTVERMPRLDVVVLRVGLFELLHRPDVPTAAVLSEAVDLAGRYGTDDSSRFVNGLLSAAAGELRGDTTGTSD